MRMQAGWGVNNLMALGRVIPAAAGLQDVGLLRRRVDAVLAEGEHASADLFDVAQD
jgi:hypothetical protein